MANDLKTTYGLAGLALTIAITANGCLPRQYVAVEQPATAPIMEPAVDISQWREEYTANRPEAPRHFEVPPKLPRNNGFSEFDEQRFTGLDRQPRLPAIPPSPLQALGPEPPYQNSQNQSMQSVPGSIAPIPPPMMPLAPGGREGSTVQNRPAGFTAGDHLYPVEQLVYGGAYPDLDKPESYRLMPRDTITITVMDHPEFSGRTEVQADGTISIHNAPDVIQVRGLQIDEAEEKVRQALSVYIRGEAAVRIQANQVGGMYYYVFGDVSQPGRFPMGMEPIRLSEAVLAANWEADPRRRHLGGDDLTPSFPAAIPRGRYAAPESADMTRVFLITPHRSQPVRSVHNIQQAMLGAQAEDPLIRPGQIVVVASRYPHRNTELGLGQELFASLPPQSEPVPAETHSLFPTPAPVPGGTGTDSIDPTGDSAWTEVLSTRERPLPLGMSPVETNMAEAYDSNRNTSDAALRSGVTVERPVTFPTVHAGEYPMETGSIQAGHRRAVIRRQRRNTPFTVEPSSIEPREPQSTEWKKGF